MRHFSGRTDYEKEFLKLFNELCYSRQRWDVWQDLIAVMACSLSNAADHTAKRFEDREKEYAKRIERLGGVEVASKAFSIVVLALESNPDQDFLGDMYMRLDLGSNWHGQFFTPYCISKMMAEMMMGNLKQQVEEQGWVSVCDPCIGGGAMLVAAANVAKEQEINYQTNMLFVAQDIDRVVGQMAYVQMSLLGCPGYVVIANTITNPVIGDKLMPTEKEEQEFWYTPFYFLQEWHFRRQAKLLSRLFIPEKENEKKVDEKFTFFFDFEEENYGQETT